MYVKKIRLYIACGFLVTGKLVVNMDKTKILIHSKKVLIYVMHW